MRLAGIGLALVLAAAPAAADLSIVGPSATVEVDLVDVFEIVPLEQSFWKRLDGSINFGLSYTQANDSLQYKLSGDGRARVRAPGPGGHRLAHRGRGRRRPPPGPHPNTLRNRMGKLGIRRPGNEARDTEA